MISEFLSVFYPKENVIPPIEKIIFNPPATIVFWDDGEKTVVKCRESEKFDCECGLAFAIAKRYFGSRSKFKKAIGQAKKSLSKWVVMESQKVVIIYIQKDKDGERWRAEVFDDEPQAIEWLKESIYLTGVYPYSMFRLPEAIRS